VLWPGSRGFQAEKSALRQLLQVAGYLALHRGSKLPRRRRTPGIQATFMLMVSTLRRYVA
jgi:hypothetical protein